jgi:hypothetical protein
VDKGYHESKYFLCKRIQYIPGPLISGGIILSELFYSKSIIDSHRIIALNQRYNEIEKPKGQ